MNRAFRLLWRKKEIALQTKLPLQMDGELIARAKAHAVTRNRADFAG